MISEQWVKQKIEWLTARVNAMGGGGSSSYSDLTNKPQINNTTLVGNKLADELGLPTYKTLRNVDLNNIEEKVLIGGWMQQEASTIANKPDLGTNYDAMFMQITNSAGYRTQFVFLLDGANINKNKGYHRIVTSSGSVNKSWTSFFVDNSNEVLWRNSSEATAYTGETITFSKSLSDYRLIVFEYRLSTSDATRSTLVVPYEELKEKNPHLILFFNLSSTVPYRRTVTYISDNSVTFSNGYSGSSTQSGAYAIPTKIYGIH